MTAILPRHGPAPAAATAAAGAAPVLRGARLPNGVTLHCAVQGGPAAGTPLLLLHGYTDSWFSFAGVLAHLPPGLHAVAPSQRGHGESDRPEGAAYGTADLAADTVALMDALGIGAAVIAGHSMGSLVAQRVALDHSERVRGLALLGAFPTYRGNPEIRALWEECVRDLRDPVDPGFVRAFQESTLARPVPPAFLDAVVAESLKLPARVWRAALAEQLEEDATAELGRIRAPTLILWGDRDGLAHRAGQEVLEEAIPRARLLTYAGAGHAPHWEEPARVAADLARFAAAVG